MPHAVRIMGVLNVTPDSFSDGGRHNRPDEALKRAAQMVSEGADIIDVGGESTRPGADAVDEQQELDRVIPVVEAVHREFDTVVSIDTRKPRVMREAVSAGARFINDVSGLREHGALETVARLGVPVCIMHMQGRPHDMQFDPHYDDVVAEVLEYLLARAAACEAAGVAREHIVIDPGLGFGKTVEHNLTLLANLPRFASAGFEVLIGASRKQTIGTVLGRSVDDRLYGSIGLAVHAALNGAAIVRVHDVGATADAVTMALAVEARR